MMRDFIATNTKDIEEDTDRGCRAYKEIGCLKKYSYCCAVLWTSCFPPMGLRWADINLAFPGEPSRAAALSPTLQGWPFLSLNHAICPMATQVWCPNPLPWLKPTQIFLVPFHVRRTLRCLLGVLQQKGLWDAFRRNYLHSDYLW